jgi:hypothetical protein
MFRRSVVLVLCLAILNLGSPLVAQAAIIGTLQAAEANSRSADLAAINSTLAREQVREQFVALGVDPAQVERRVAALTDSELHMLAERMETMPAGGDSVLAIIGIVFLVLLILELVGVIDIFKKIP